MVGCGQPAVADHASGLRAHGLVGVLRLWGQTAADLEPPVVVLPDHLDGAAATIANGHLYRGGVAVDVGVNGDGLVRRRIGGRGRTCGDPDEVRPAHLGLVLVVGHVVVAAVVAAGQ